MPLILIIVLSPLPRLSPTILADWDLNTLCRETLAKWRTLYHAGELLGRVHGKHIAVTQCKDGCLSSVEDRHLVRGVAVGGLGGAADVGERESETACVSRVREIGDWRTYRKFPSVLMLMSCSTNQMPILSWGSASLEALAARLPIRLRVNMPSGWLATGAGGRGGRAGSYIRLLRS